MNINKNFLENAVELFNVSEDVKTMNNFTQKELEVLLENRELLFKEFNTASNDFEIIFTGINSKIELGNGANPYCNVYSNNFMEEDLQKQIIENWDEYFPEYEFIDNEVTIPQGRIDLLGKDKKSGRDVIIELKYPKGKINRQLFDYMENYDNPILVAVNSVDRSKSKRIIYKNIDTNRKLDKSNIEYVDKDKYDIYKKLQKALSIIYHLCSWNCYYGYFLNNMYIRTQLYNIALNDYFTRVDEQLIKNIINEHVIWCNIWFASEIKYNVKELIKFNNMDSYTYYKLLADDYCLDNRVIFGEFDEHRKFEKDFHYNFDDIAIRTNVCTFKNVVKGDYRNIHINREFALWYLEEGYSSVEELIEYEIKNGDTCELEYELSTGFKYGKILFEVKPDEYEINELVNGDINYNEYLPIIVKKFLEEDKYTDSYIAKFIVE